MLPSWFATRRHFSARYIARGQAWAQTVRMGTHGMDDEAVRVAVPHQAQLITVQAWPVMGKTHMTVFVTYADESGPRTMNTGAELLEYNILSMPSLGQVVWLLGDEIQHSWRELSTPR